jgi:Protein of unknown function with HXXEE motif
MIMNQNAIFWIAMAAYAVHMMEEFFYDWKDWAVTVLKLPVDWPGFYVTNTAVLFLGIACAEVGWNFPWLSLAFPALMLINAFFFHVLPVIIKKKFSPGLFTALGLFFPVGIYSFKMALDRGVHVQEILVSFLIGILLMAYPIILLKTKHLRFFSFR